MQGIVGALLTIFLWLLIWLCPMLLTITVVCLLVWALLGGDYLVLNIGMVVPVGVVIGLLPATVLTERIRRRYGLLNFYAMLLNNRELNQPGSPPNP